MPISVNKALGAKDCCPLCGAVISADGSDGRWKAADLRFVELRHIVRQRSAMVRDLRAVGSNDRGQ
jgi:hypothetical protein